MPADLRILKTRARIVQQIRAFFARLEYLEVDTPLLGISTNTDAHIQSILASVNGQVQYLQTSPEFAMKRLLAAGSGSIYQIAHAFRDEEQGRRHRPEFSLLEWYSVGFDYQQLMDQVQQLINQLFESEQPFQRLAYYQAFEQALDVNLKHADIETCRSQVQRHVPGIDAQTLNRDQCLDLLISEVVSKRLQGFTFIFDYPASQAALAKLSRSDSSLAERFELFYNDMELANGFSELTDVSEQRLRLEADNRQRADLGLDVYPIDEAFLQALEQGLPDCAGVALGLDRLLMVLMDLSSIDQALSLDDSRKF